MEFVEITRKGYEVQTRKRPISQRMDSSGRFKGRFRAVKRSAVALPFISLALVALAGGRSFGRPGDLDPSFGSNGIVATSLGSMADHTRRLRIQPDGKILVLASDSTSSNRAPSGSAIYRFLPNGQYDTSFAGGSGLRAGNVRDFALLGDGRIITVGHIGVNSDLSSVCRYSANGFLDTTFATNGCGALYPGILFRAEKLIVRPDGKIIVAGVGENAHAIIARLIPNGSIDPSFGNSGFTVTTAGDRDYYVVGPWVLSKFGDLGLQADGKILFGYSYDWDNAFYLSRLNEDGSVDTDFGETGRATIVIPVESYPYDAFAFGINVLPDRKIVVTGSALQWWGADSNVTIAKLNNDGSLDTDFGSYGYVDLVSSETRGPASTMIVLPTGKILLGGMDDQAFSLLRLNANGSFDTRFGNNGIIQTRFGTSNMTSILAMELQNDGSLIAAGSINGANRSANIGLAKYRDVAAVPAGTQYDFDGDGKADLSVFRPSETNWYLNRSSSGFYVAQFGLSTDVITPADYDGDGKTDISVFRDGTWFWLNSSNGEFNARQFGEAADVPVAADFSGDGRADLGIFRGGVWWIQDIANNSVSVTSFGLATDVPVVADYDGDGRTDMAVFRSGEWHLDLSGSGHTIVNFGMPGDSPLVGDFDGDGRADPAVYRQGVWFVQRSTEGYLEVPFGLATDLPVPADYDGDGKTDAAIYREGTWWVLQSSTQSPTVAQFGIGSDRPIPYRDAAN